MSAAVSVGVILVAQVVSHALIGLPERGVGSVFIDTAIIIGVMVPALSLLIFRPLSRLLDERRLADRRLQTRATELTALYGITEAARGDFDMDRLLTRVLDVAITAFGAGAGWISALDGGCPRASRLVAVRGVSDDLVSAEEPKLRPACATCTAWCVSPTTSGRTLAATECEKTLGDPLLVEGFQRHRGVLLPAGSRGDAVLNLLWRAPDHKVASEDSLLGAIARQVEIAVENSNLFTAEKVARKHADTLRSASLAITRSLDIEAVFPALLQHLGTLVPFDRAKVMLFESKSRVRVRAIFTADGILDFQEVPLGTFDSEANATVKEVLASGRSVCVADTQEEPGWGTRGQSDIERSWLGVPLMAAGEAIGLFTLVKAEPGFFTPERVQLVEALSAPASVAIANARLFEEVLSGREQIQKMARKLVEGQENERRRIARELHDEAGQLLTSLMLGLRLLENKTGSPEEVRGSARELKNIAGMVQEGLHRLASDLRPAALDHVGLVPALGHLVAGFSRAGGPAIRLETFGFDGKRFSPDVDIALYRIAQEALTNAVRHSGAKEVSVVLTLRGAGISLVVEDDGRGFDVEAASQSSRLGLPGIRERAEMLGGKLLVESSPGSSTTLVVEIPNVN